MFIDVESRNCPGDMDIEVTDEDGCDDDMFIAMIGRGNCIGCQRT